MTCTRSGTSRKAKILVVDNEQMLALALCTILQSHGYEVATAFSGEEAIALAARFIPDLLVSDVRLGATSGVKVATQITNIFPHCSVLFLSGLSSMSDVLRVAPKRLVYSFVSKPLQLLDLLNAIAYKLSAVKPLHDQAMMDMGHDLIHRDVLRRMPINVGYI
jgi:two-component system, response regulator RegA